MICKWKTECVRCGTTVEEGEEVFFSNGVLGEKEKICWLCASIEGIVCACGNKKKPEHATCYDCKRADDEAQGLRCVCGNYKKPQYKTCYDCKRLEVKS